MSSSLIPQLDTPPGWLDFVSATGVTSVRFLRLLFAIWGLFFFASMNKSVCCHRSQKTIVLERWLLSLILSGLLLDICPSRLLGSEHL